MISEEQEISEIRKKIDDLDKDLINILNERAKLSYEIRTLKNRANLPILDEQRENEILTKITLLNEGPLDEDSVRDIYSKILVRMKNFE